MYPSALSAKNHQWRCKSPVQSCNSRSKYLVLITSRNPLRCALSRVSLNTRTHSGPVEWSPGRPGTSPDFFLWRTSQGRWWTNWRGTTSATHPTEGFVLRTSLHHVHEESDPQFDEKPASAATSSRSSLSPLRHDSDRTCVTLLMIDAGRPVSVLWVHLYRVSRSRYATGFGPTVKLEFSVERCSFRNRWGGLSYRETLYGHSTLYESP